jgi:hypothetical protein
MVSPETQAHLVINAFGIAVYAGFYIATIRFHSTRLKELGEKDQEHDKTLGVHDREIGNVYGRLQMPREVRR